MAGFDNEVLYASGIRLEPSDAQAIQLMQLTATDVSRINYTGDPEGAVSANPSSLSHDPVSGVIYQKVSGTGNTGWAAMGGGGSSVYFQSYLTSPVTVAASDTTFTIIFDTPTVNVGSGYNAATGVFTAPSTGFYAFNSTVYFNDLNSALGLSQMILAYTGSVQSLRLVQEGIQAVVTGNVIIFNAGWSMPMTSGDTIQMQPFVDGSSGSYQIYGAPLSSSAFNTSSVFSGFKVA
jgi:hypothetical protein